MGWENTVTEYDMDPASRQFLQGLSQDGNDAEPDLAVDGFSESVMSRLAGIFGFLRR
jgi:hypothetical protein